MNTDNMQERYLSDELFLWRKNDMVVCLYMVYF